MSVAQIVFDQKTLNTKKIVDEVRDRTHNTLFSSQLKNRPIMLEYLFLASPSTQV